MKISGSGQKNGPNLSRQNCRQNSAGKIPLDCQGTEEYFRSPCHFSRCLADLSTNLQLSGFSLADFEERQGPECRYCL
jgi:hypothetical protein